MFAIKACLSLSVDFTEEDNGSTCCTQVGRSLRVS